MDKIDMDLWRQCAAAVPRRPIPPRMLPFQCKPVDGCRVLLVDGDLIKVKEDKPEDSEHPHMDFVEGANDMEAAWVKREFGKNTLLLDDRLSPADWPFILYHEAGERRYMAQGMSYNRAHVKINKQEKILRLHARGVRHARRA